MFLYLHLLGFHTLEVLFLMWEFYHGEVLLLYLNRIYFPPLLILCDSDPVSSRFC